MIDDWFYDSFVDELKEIFHPLDVVISPGIGDGYVVKFVEFYLKIYPDENEEGTYIIEQYKYSQNVIQPITVDHIKYNRFKDYAKQLKLTI